MYPPKFDYYRAQSVSEAVSLLREHSGAEVLAGGHSLLPVMKLRLSQPGVLVDIGRIESLKGITANGDGGFRIGALTTHAEVAADERLPTALTEAASMIGDPQVRNRGTVGGNVAHADPASDLPTVFVALGATFNVQGPDGERQISAEDCFTGLFTTDMRKGEILTSVDIPAQENGTGSAYEKMFNPATRYALVGAAASLTMDGQTCRAAHVAVGSLTPSATHARSVEEALEGQPLDDEVIAAAAARVAGDVGDDLLGDIHASADYRRKMAPVYVRRALMKALSRSG
ncbi:MAG TPA: xanthine dehydrogenase family protein subunit M [Candidatus Sulfomarinibacteraceae bacterium]|nr:xanthine dehydrogenase family protein subunit M [Candidatus Sulfomarinibacteraceae bacterium]